MLSHGCSSGHRATNSTGSLGGPLNCDVAKLSCDATAGKRNRQHATQGVDRCLSQGALEAVSVGLVKVASLLEAFRQIFTSAASDTGTEVHATHYDGFLGSTLREGAGESADGEALHGLGGDTADNASSHEAWECFRKCTADQPWISQRIDGRIARRTAHSCTTGARLIKYLSGECDALVARKSQISLSHGGHVAFCATRVARLLTIVAIQSALGRQGINEEAAHGRQRPVQHVGAGFTDDAELTKPLR
ncbi:hypothetical protein D3C77_94510 [compost metagenome]